MLRTDHPFAPYINELDAHTEAMRLTQTDEDKWTYTVEPWGNQWAIVVYDERNNRLGYI
jgi:hypothetical protein